MTLKEKRLLMVPGVKVRVIKNDTFSSDLSQLNRIGKEGILCDEYVNHENYPIKDTIQVDFGFASANDHLQDNYDYCNIRELEIVPVYSIESIIKDLGKLENKIVRNV